jgi:hypothetical protein
MSRKCHPDAPVHAVVGDHSPEVGKRVSFRLRNTCANFRSRALSRVFLSGTRHRRQPRVKIQFQERQRFAA